MTDQSKPTTDMPDVIYVTDIEFMHEENPNVYAFLKRMKGQKNTKYIRADLVPAAPTGDKAAVHMAAIDGNGIVEQSTMTLDIETPKEKKKSPETDKAEIAYWDFDARHKGYGEYKLSPQSERDAFKAVYRKCLQENTAPDDLVKALEFYGELDNYRGGYCGDGDGPFSNVSVDNGSIAREALASNKAKAP